MTKMYKGRINANHLWELKGWRACAMVIFMFWWSHENQLKVKHWSVNAHNHNASMMPKERHQATDVFLKRKKDTACSSQEVWKNTQNWEELEKVGPYSLTFHSFMPSWAFQRNSTYLSCMRRVLLWITMAAFFIFRYLLFTQYPRICIIIEGVH